MIEKYIRQLLELIRRKLETLPPHKSYERECLTEAERLMEEVIQDLRNLNMDRAIIDRKISRALLLAGEGSVYEE